MNRHNQIESAVFLLVGSLYFRMIPFQFIKRSQQLSLFRVMAVKRLPAHKYSVVIFTFSGLLGLLGSDIRNLNTAK